MEVDLHAALHRRRVARRVLRDDRDRVVAVGEVVRPEPQPGAGDVGARDRLGEVAGPIAAVARCAVDEQLRLDADVVGRVGRHGGRRRHPSVGEQRPGRLQRGGAVVAEGDRGAAHTHEREREAAVVRGAARDRLALGAGADDPVGQPRGVQLVGLRVGGARRRHRAHGLPDRVGTRLTAERAADRAAVGILPVDLPTVAGVGIVGVAALLAVARHLQSHDPRTGRRLERPLGEGEEARLGVAAALDLQARAAGLALLQGLIGAGLGPHAEAGDLALPRVVLPASARPLARDDCVRACVRARRERERREHECPDESLAHCASMPASPSPYSAHRRSSRRIALLACEPCRL